MEGRIMKKTIEKMTAKTSSIFMRVAMTAVLVFGMAACGKRKEKIKILYEIKPALNAVAEIGKETLEFIRSWKNQIHSPRFKSL